MTRFFSSAFLILICDQVTKWIVRERMELGQTIPVLGDWLRLRFVHNSGAAFGLFQGSRTVFIVISVISVAVVLYLIISGRYNVRGSRLAFGMVLGGALGNLIDRVWFSFVVDFIDMGFGAHRWPTYNVADIGVTLGVLFLAASFVGSEWEQRHHEEDGPGEPRNPDEDHV